MVSIPSLVHQSISANGFQQNCLLVYATWRRLGTHGKMFMNYSALKIALTCLVHLRTLNNPAILNRPANLRTILAANPEQIERGLLLEGRILSTKPQNRDPHLRKISRCCYEEEIHPWINNYTILKIHLLTYYQSYWAHRRVIYHPRHLRRSIYPNRYEVHTWACFDLASRSYAENLVLDLMWLSDISTSSP